MINLSYSITESIYRRYGHITKLIYDYEENQEQYELDLLTEKQEYVPIYRHYRAIIKRNEYERLIETYMVDKDQLSFENFVRILRPIMMGTYIDNELREAFSLLDQNQSNTIDIDELADFLSIIHSKMTKEILLHYLAKINIKTDEKLHFNEFNDFVLHGIGRDIVCGHI
jgi:Ca2+-binding EF-hand superfamily protein